MPFSSERHSCEASDSREKAFCNASWQTTAGKFVGIATLLALVALGLACFDVENRTATVRVQQGFEEAHSAVPSKDLQAELQPMKSKWISRAASVAASRQVLQPEQDQSSAETTFGLGLHWSELAVGADGPGSSAADTGSSFYTAIASLLGGLPSFAAGAERNLARDAAGFYVPKQIALAEELMLKGELQCSGPASEDKAAQRALRLYQHARFLALHHYDAAAEWRFRAAAELSAMRQRPKLAAHSLARLSNFLMQRGRKVEALDAASASLEHAADPLAQFLQATLRRSMGLLLTSRDVEEAAEQLKATNGLALSRNFEEQRVAVLADLAGWQTAAKGGFGACLDFSDAAQVMLCLTCKAFMN